jgi:outer membrane protein OmpA-like peptidoglycan-associated protein
MEGISNLGQSLLSGGLLNTISRFVGGSPEATKKTFGAALPASMYAIADHGSTEVGARSLLDGLRSGQAPQMEVGDLERTLADPQASDRLMTSSGGFLERLLGNRAGGLFDALSSFGGLGSGACSKVMALAAPLAMGLIGRRAREGNLDAGGLSRFLRDQKPSLASQLPGPLRSVMGLPAAERVVEPIGEERRRREVQPTHITAGRKRSWWPFVLAGLAALVGILWLAGRPRRAVAPTARGPEPVARQPREVTPPAAPPAAAPELEREPVAGTMKRPALTSGSPAVTQLSDYLAGNETAPKRLSLSGLNFATGVSRLDPEGERIGDDIASLMKANPNAKIRVEGYADARGDAAANKQLAQARADSLKRHLIDKGVAAERIDTASLGEERPVAPEETVTGRAENRRVEIIVSKR